MIVQFLPHKFNLDFGKPAKALTSQTSSCALLESVLSRLSDLSSGVVKVARVSSWRLSGAVFARIPGRTSIKSLAPRLARCS